MRTYTNSETFTYTEARARYVMGKVKEDLLGLMNRKLITFERVQRIHEEVLYLLNKQALTFFELQFKNANGETIGGLHYKVQDGQISTDEKSGGINYWSLPQNTQVGLLISLNYESPNIDEVNEQLEKWNFGTGSALTGSHKHLKDYSKEGYGLSQTKIGDW